MDYATAWFLVMMGSQYIGPLPQQKCQEAAARLSGEAVVCRQATAMMACGVDGQPGTYTACPVFDFPHVTLRRE